MKAAYDLTKRSLADLIDHSIPETDETRIKEIICEHSSIYAGFHDLKTRWSGPEIFIEFHLVVPGNISVVQSHDLTDHLESDLNTDTRGHRSPSMSSPVPKGNATAVGNSAHFPRSMMAVKSQWTSNGNLLSNLRTPS